MRPDKMTIKGQTFEFALPETIEEARQLWGDAHFLALAIAEYRRTVRYARRPDHKALVGRLASVRKEDLDLLLTKLKEKS